MRIQKMPTESSTNGNLHMVTTSVRVRIKVVDTRRAGWMITKLAVALVGTTIAR
jgi:hypothetical protein